MSLRSSSPRLSAARPRWWAALVVAAIAAGPSGSAHAADWVMIVGSEEGRPDEAVQVNGFVQASARTVVGALPVRGLESEALAPFEGKTAAFNAFQGPVEVRVRRARVGLRGSVPATGQRVSYFLSVEGGMNAANRGQVATLLDASITVSVIPGLRLRLGQFKVPTMDEALESIPLVQNSIDFSLVASQLLFENPVEGGQFAGPGWAFRDLGVQAFDTLQVGPLAVAWAVMAHQGQKGAVDPDAGKDITGRLQLSWVFGGKATSPFREELSVFGWWSQGPRLVGPTPVLRVRQGAGAFLRYGPVRARVEVVGGQGAIPVGTNPPFPGQPQVVLPEGFAWGFSSNVRLRLGGRLFASLGLDQYHRQPQEPVQARAFTEALIGAQYEFTPRARLLVDYRFRHLAAPGASADVQRIAATMGDVASVQMSVAF